MKIRTQFIFSLSLFALILPVMALSLFVTNQQVDSLLQQDEIANYITRGANNLSYLAGDYLMYGESQQHDRWEAEFILLSAYVSMLKPTNPEQQTIVSHIIDNQVRLQGVFRDVEASIEKSAQPSQTAIDSTFKQEAWSQMKAQSQATANESALLSQKLSDEVDRMKQLSSQLMAALVGIFGIFLLSNYFLIQQQILRSISELHAGTLIIGSGNLDFKIPVKRKDEIGDLTSAFNQMAVNLKRVTTSRDDLEHEILERIQVEKTLQEVNEELQVITEELRVQNEELRDAHSALEDSEARLRFVLDACHVGTWEMDSGSHKINSSPEYNRLHGFRVPLGSWSYEKWLELVHPEDRRRVDETWAYAIQNQGSWDCEFRILRLDGQTCWLWVLGAQRLNAQGEVRSMAGIVQDITERKQAEEQLRYQAAMLSNVNDAVVASDSQYRITAWNLAAEELYGWKADEVIGCNGLDIVQTQWPKKDADEMRRTIAETNRWRGEATQIRKDGTRFPVEVSSIVLHDDTGQITGYVSVNHDITDRKRAEEQIARTNQKMNEILMSIQDDFYVLDRNWIFVYANRLFTSRVGKEPEDFIGKNIWEMFPKHVGTILEENFCMAMEKREIRRFEIGGKYTSAWYQMTAFPSAEGITVLGTDITERKRAEDAFKESQKRYQDLIETASDFIWESDSQGRFTYCSPQAELLWGYKPDDLLGKIFIDILPPGEKEKAWESFQELAGTITPIKSLNTTVYNSWGELVIVETNGIPFFDDAGKFLGYRGITRDVTARKHAETALQQSKATLLSFYDSAPFMMGIAELAGDHIVMISGNRAAAQFFEVQPKELPGKTGAELAIPVKYERMWVENYRYSQESGVPVHFEYEYPRPGGVRWLNATAAFIEIGLTGKPHFSFVIEDITERKNVEQALLLTQADLEHAQEVGQIGSWRLDVRQNMLTWSNETYRIFGIPLGTPMTYDAFMESVHPDDREYVNEQWNAALHGEPYDIEHRIIVKGQVKWVREKAYLESNSSGEFLGGFGISQDITKRKKDEEELRAVNEELTRFNKAMVGRELRVIELKKEVNGLCEIANQPQRYSLDFEKNGIEGTHGV